MMIYLEQASRFTPNSPVGFSTTTDVGSQYGSTFDGFGSFATSTYMVPLVEIQEKETEVVVY